MCARYPVSVRGAAVQALARAETWVFAFSQFVSDEWVYDDFLEFMVPACLRRLKTSDPREALRKITAQPALAGEVIEVVLLGVTDFFRDRLVFEKLGRDVLPALLSRYAKVRVWSAACSEGQELYSVAMLLARAGRLGDCELWGTDCRPEAIVRARQGVFACEQVARLDPAWRQSFFNRAGMAGAIVPELRHAPRWKTANLFEGAEPGPWHLILWRNMAIYLEAERAGEIWKKLSEQLAPGGFLLVGKADHPPPGLPLARVGACVYRKRGS
jgi:chemotaxis protein methyltransferase CheR